MVLFVLIILYHTQLTCTELTTSLVLSLLVVVFWKPTFDVLRNFISKTICKC